MSDPSDQGGGTAHHEQSLEPMVVSLGANGSTHGPVARTVAHQAPGVLHLAVSVQVVDLARQRWLLQRRSAAKTLFANRWANTCCTHPAPGEEPASAAFRRVQEETGLVVEDLVCAGSFIYRATDPDSGLVEYEHDVVFVAVADIRAAEPDPEEISELALLPFEEALVLLQSDAGVPWAADVLRRSYIALDGRHHQGPPTTGRHGDG